MELRHKLDISKCDVAVNLTSPLNNTGIVTELGNVTLVDSIRRKEEKAKGKEQICIEAPESRIQNYADANFCCKDTERHICVEYEVDGEMVDSV